MSITDTYEVNSDWGSLTTPLLRSLEKHNGIAGTLVDRLHWLGLAQFQNSQVPGRKNEDWKYTPLRELLNTTFSESSQPFQITPAIKACFEVLDAIRIVIVNGHFVPQVSDAIMPEGVWVGPLQDALKDKTAARHLEYILAQLESTSMTPFEALATSITSPGMCLSVESDVNLSKPIHFLHITDNSTETPTNAYPYKILGIGKNANVQIVESFINLNGGSIAFTNSVNHIHVESGAHLWHHRLQEENMHSFHINMTRVFQEKDCEYTSVAVELGSKLMRNNIEVIHQGTGITSNIFGVFMAEDRQHTDTQSFIDHAMPHCESHELYKGILDGYARGVFNGKIIVRPDAQKTNAFQQNNTLLLSKDAIMDSKPQLEIFADDVKCSHGATIGQLDEEAVFYLRSRGLSRAQASALLQRAFVGEVLDKCEHEKIRNYLNQKVATKHHD
jgi:Fe-S cluster assembly protein SufD